MPCPACGTPNPPGGRFCVNCGCAVAGCPRCGTAIAGPGQRFCGQCGAQLGDPANQGQASLDRPAAAPGPAGGPAAAAERRLVSVLFADLVGFTSLVESRDPEDTRELLGRYFDLASDIVTRYGGTVEKFIGDAVMAVWGAPIAREDDAERSVRAAMDLVETVRAVEPGLVARAGIVTGEAAVTVGATDQRIVAGDLVNTASRLQAAAPAGTVLVDGATQRAAARGIAFESRGEQQLKGKSAPVAAWRALRAVAEMGGRNRAATLEAPFVGRDEELRLVKDLFRATGRDRRLRLLSVIGEAGIGKSRLAWEFLKWIDGILEPVWWHEGRCPAYGDKASFRALVEMVRHRCELAESDDETATRSKVGETVRRFTHDEAEAIWIEDALLALLGVVPSPVSRRESLFGAWRRFFELIAEQGVAILVFEDLQWADPGLLAFIDSLTDWSRSSAIFVLALGRPDLLDRRPDWGSAHRGFAALRLDPLTAGAMRELLSGLVPGLRDSLREAIVARADGVPLYAIEIVRMLLAEGRLRLDGTQYTPADDLADLAVPETLHALISARLDALGRAESALLRDAAILGQTFDVRALAALSGEPEEALAGRLTSLVRHELLERDASATGADRLAFVQGLVREVAYGTVSKRDRRRGHLAAARHFGALGDGELAGAAAGHYLVAYRLGAGSPDVEPIAEEVRTALCTAAEHALGLQAQEQAMSLFDQALEVECDRRTRGAMLRRAGEAASDAGSNERAEAYLRAAIDAFRSEGDVRATVGALAALGNALINGYRQVDALPVLEAAAAEASALSNEDVGIELDAALCRALAMVGRHREAIAVSDRALEAAEHLGIMEIVADLLITRGISLASIDRPIEGKGDIRTGTEVAREAGLESTTSRGLLDLGHFLYDEDPVAAFVATVEALEISRRIGHRTWLGMASGNATENAVIIGRWDWAIAEIDRALSELVDRAGRSDELPADIMIRSGRGEPVDDRIRELEALLDGIRDPEMAAMEPFTKAWAALASGSLADARRHAERTARAGGEFYAREALLLLARVALWGRDAPAALDALTRHTASEGARGARIEIERRGIRAGIAALEGRHDLAVAEYREVLAGWRRLGCVFLEALTAIDMAATLPYDDSLVAGAVASARAILTELRADAYLARLDDALGRRATPVASGSAGLGRPDPVPVS